jgi:hypothetical protein
VLSFCHSFLVCCSCSMLKHAGLHDSFVLFS